MNVTWHIIAKDLRRMRWPVAGWLAFIVAGASWFAGRRLPDEVALSGDVSHWMAAVSNLTGVAMSLQFVVGVLLAGALVLEDGVASTNCWWRTRPISGWRLLAAKVTAAGLLLVAPPTVALVVVWSANGFTWAECLVAAGNFAAWQTGGATLVALAFAAMSVTLAQFVFSLCGATVVYTILASRLLSRWLGCEESVRGGRSVGLVVALLPLLIAVAVLAVQFLIRRTRRSWIIVGFGCAMALVVRFAWPWDFLAPESSRAAAPIESRWEMAPTVGAEWRAGAERARVCAVTEPGRETPLAVVVEERGSQLGLWAGDKADGIGYFLVNRGGNERAFRLVRSDSVWMDSMWLAVKHLELSEATPADWAQSRIVSRTRTGSEKDAVKRKDR